MSKALTVLKVVQSCLPSNDLKFNESEAPCGSETTWKGSALSKDAGGGAELVCTDISRRLNFSNNFKSTGHDHFSICPKDLLVDPRCSRSRNSLLQFSRMTVCPMDWKMVTNHSFSWAVCLFHSPLCANLQAHWTAVVPKRLRETMATTHSSLRTFAAMYPSCNDFSKLKDASCFALSLCKSPPKASGNLHTCRIIEVALLRTKLKHKPKYSRYNWSCTKTVGSSNAKCAKWL